MKKLLILLLVSFIYSPSMALANNYRIQDVRVDIESDKATQARDEAMTQARRNAFNVLMWRLNVQSDLTADDGVIATLVDSFEINREKTSNNRYLASVNVTFNERAVQSYLARNTTMAISDDYYQANPTITPRQQPETAYDIDNRNRQAVQTPAYQPQTQFQSPAAEYRMQVSINDLRDWAVIRQRLETIGHVHVSRINTRMAVIVLQYQGRPETLQSSLNKKGFQIYSNQNPVDAPYILMRNG